VRYLTVRYLTAIALLFLAISAKAQTVANFDNPPCSGNGVKIYQGIDFSLSPWDCESDRLASDSTETLSWYQNISSGQFKFEKPSVLKSLLGGSTAGGGTLTISDDQGEKVSVTLSATPGLQPITTNFTKEASVITVSYTGGWRIQLDNITYTTPTATILQLGINFLTPPTNQIMSFSNIDRFNANGCSSIDTSCTEDVQICDEGNNCLTFGPGQHIVSAYLRKNGAPTLIWSASGNVTLR
jgi:hypothetical protein